MASADGKHQGEDGLRGVRAAGEERRQVDAGRDQRGGEPEAEQVHRDGVCGAGQGAGAGEEHGQGGGDVALRAIHDDHLPLRRRRLRQEGPGGLRPQRAAGHGRPQRARGQVHEHVQRRERQRMHCHVMIPGVSRWLGMAVAMAMDALVCMLACSDGGLKRNMFASNEFVCVRCINVDHVFGSQQEKQVE